MKKTKLLSIVLAAVMLCLPISVTSVNAVSEGVKSQTNLKNSVREPDRYRIMYYTSYGERVMNEYKDYFTPESVENISPYVDYAKSVAHKTSTQKEIDYATKNLENALSELNPVSDDENIVLYPEAKELCDLIDNYYIDNFYNKNGSNYMGSRDHCAFGPEFIKFNGYRIVTTHFNTYWTAICPYEINEYYYESYNGYAPSSLGAFAINTESDEVVMLENALSNNIIDDDALYKYSRENKNGLEFMMYLNGDADLDGKLSIKDATLIQKELVNLAEFNSEKYRNVELLADFNYDGRVSVSDATRVQKRLCSLV